MGELIGAHKQAINHEGWVVQGEMVCVNGPVEQPQREDALFLPSLSTQIGEVSSHRDVLRRAASFITFSQIVCEWGGTHVLTSRELPAVGHGDHCNDEPQRGG